MNTSIPTIKMFENRVTTKPDTSEIIMNAPNIIMDSLYSFSDTIEFLRIAMHLHGTRRISEINNIENIINTIVTNWKNPFAPPINKLAIGEKSSPSTSTSSTYSITGCAFLIPFAYPRTFNNNSTIKRNKINIRAFCDLDNSFIVFKLKIPHF